VAVGERKITEICSAGFGYSQRVEREQAGQHVVVATGQPGLDEERAKLGPVEAEPSRLLRDLRSAYVDRRGVIQQLFLDAVAVEAGEHDQFERDRCRSEAPGFEITGVQLDMRAADVGEWLEVVLLAPVEPETYLGCVRLPGAG
jgi:hypothetical protein